MATRNNHNTCYSICLAKQFDFETLCQKFLKADRAVRYRDALWLERVEGFIFAYGVAVFWNINRDQLQGLIAELEPFLIMPLKKIEEDTFPYTTGADSDRFLQDRIHLQKKSPMSLLAISHGLAQSVKLSVFEDQVQQTISETAHIPESLAQTGRTRLSRRQISKIRGRLFLTKSDILVHFDLLNTPEFFWEYPELEPLYQMTARYLELKSRTEIVARKLETIHELFQMLADEQAHAHSATLEWIIIWLIAIDIILIMLHDMLGWL